MVRSLCLRSLHASSRAFPTAQAALIVEEDTVPIKVEEHPGDVPHRRVRLPPATCIRHEAPLEAIEATRLLARSKGNGYAAF